MTKYNLPKDYISFSQVNTYLNCPENYRRKYILEEPRINSSVPTLGQFVHAGVEDMLQRVIDGHDLPPAEAVQDWCSDHLDEYAERVDEWESFVRDKDHMETRARNALRIYHTHRAPQVRPLEVEKKIWHEIDDGLVLMGFIDLIEEGSAGYDSTVGFESPGTDGKRIVDLKTTRRCYPKKRVETSVQLSLYAHAEGCTDVGYDLIVQKKEPEFVPQRAQRSQQDLQHAVTIVKGVARAISAGIFHKTTPDNWLCQPRYCQFYHDCYGQETS